jgi:hypothetical protein
MRRPGGHGCGAAQRLQPTRVEPLPVAVTRLRVMAKVTVQRKGGLSGDPIRKYKVLIDGQEVGKVGRGESVSAEVQPGPHEVQLKLGSGRSPVMSVEASGEEEVRLHCIKLERVR